ncbi:hypothetical protein TNCV_2546701, partial [Trichonephila clavipes]
SSQREEISMRSTKELIKKKSVLMPVKHNVFRSGTPLRMSKEVPSHDGETV